MSAALNPQQQQAVDQIYGPLLVLAGPGTGKTQLLSARIANILQKTDANPSNILCLTFTDNAALNMRQRLGTIIGEASYDVHIATYHSFGSDIISNYPEYFSDINLETGKDSRLERPIDELQKIQMVAEIVNSLPFSSPLIGARRYPKNIVSTLSELKRGLYTPASLRKLSEDNLQLMAELNPFLAGHLGKVARMPSRVDVSLELFGPILEELQSHSGLAELAADELAQAMAEASEQGSSKPLTAWKNHWLQKDHVNRFIFTDPAQHRRIAELANVYEKYQYQLRERGLYDFDDMILRVLETLEAHDDLRFSLQEKYQFILLDEFQDTNASQFELVRKLADSPAAEGQPNVFAVGDDDQAIYAFQGARAGNMLQFTQAFSPVALVNLTENYRSHPDILHVAHNVAEQIEFRLHRQLENVHKQLQAASTQLSKHAQIERHEFAGQANEYAWVAQKIQQLVDQGVSPSEIAVLAPRHKQLEPLVPFLAQLNLPVAYEKRENILDTLLIRSLVLMTQLVVACRDGDWRAMNQLFPRVLSLEFYNLRPQDIWQINWQLRSRDAEQSWERLAAEDVQLAPHVFFYLQLGLQAEDLPLEHLLDYLTGTLPLSIGEGQDYTSPLKNYYFDPSKSSTITYQQSLANLVTIRSHLRNRQTDESRMLNAADLLQFVAAHQLAEQPLLNTHSIAQTEYSVQLMTAYKAKGLEFEHVFLLSLHDDVWGKGARSGGNKLTLPANLQHIRYAGSSEDELRRILFVAITRAKYGLYLTSHGAKDNGKNNQPVKYLQEQGGQERQALVLPPGNQNVIRQQFSAEQSMQQVQLLWEARHLQLSAELRSLLAPLLQRYALSPTHLNTLTDSEYGGWEVFLLNCLLRFPQAPGEDGEFGSAIHYTLEKYQHQCDAGTPDIEQTILDFDRLLAKRYISAQKLDDYRARGHRALRAFLSERQDMWQRPAKAEVNFNREGVVLEDARLTGKIDRLEIDASNKTLRIVDYKTGAPARNWYGNSKLKKYRQQLYFYKLLIEGSHTWKDYKIIEARLEFVEPEPGQLAITPPLVLEFKESDEADLKQLIQDLWRSIQTLTPPDTERVEEDGKL